MTTREAEIAKAILDVLHEEDGRQLEEITLHVAVTKRCPCALREFDAALVQVDQHGWVTGVKGRILGRLKWNINDAGEAARLEM